MTTKNTKLAAAIKKVLNKTAAQLAGTKSRAKWTKGVKDALIGLGKQRKYASFASSCDIADAGEWLYDVSWINYEDNSRNSDINPLKNVVLAAESEWSRKPFDLDDDFTKLIVARADFRVFVCWMANQQKRQKLVLRLQTLVAKSKLTVGKDEYLIACGDNKTGRFHFTPFTGADAKRKP